MAASRNRTHRSARSGARRRTGDVREART
jgi:hypothetical protein